jgi:hypothetical protein
LGVAPKPLKAPHCRTYTHIPGALVNFFGELEDRTRLLLRLELA